MSRNERTPLKPAAVGRVGGTLESIVGTVAPLPVNWARVRSAVEP